MRLLARDDPQAALFDLYAGVVQVLGSGEHGEALEPVLRAFELSLLRLLGLLPALDHETATQMRVAPERVYVLLAEGGLRQARPGERGMAGDAWCALESALQLPQGFVAVLRACAVVTAELKPPLRALLQYHCGSPVLRTRQLLMDLQTL